MKKTHSLLFLFSSGVLGSPNYAEENKKHTMGFVDTYFVGFVFIFAKRPDGLSF